MKTVIGNVLDYDGTIVHQCNAQTSRAMGLAKAIFDTYPEANIYNDGTRRVPGTIIIREPIVNLIGQKTPGKPKAGESAAMREAWFEQALIELADYCHEAEIEEVAFPYGIGCGLAGGNWDNYKAMIKQFERDSDVHVVVFKLQ